MTAYNSDKALFHLEQIDLLRKGEQPYPVHVQLIISDYCNQNCSFCAYRMENYSSNQLFKIIDLDGTVNNNPKRMIPWIKLQELVGDFVQMGVKAVQLTGGGEPTVHPQFDLLCQSILDNGMNLGLVTNGLLLKPARAQILSNAAWVRVSIDCGTPESYGRIRSVPPQEYNIVAKNIQYLTSLSRKVVVGVGFVVTKDNYKEIFDACQQYKSWGADNVRISAIFQNDGIGYFDSIYEEILEQIAQAKTLADESFAIYDNFGSRHEDLELGNPDYNFCPYMNFTTYIGGDQQVYTCCVNAYNDRGKIGSIKDQTFKELWDSANKKNFFSHFDAKKCERCMFNNKNKFINNLLRKPTVHDSFV